jgi:mRNA interferase MazF
MLQTTESYKQKNIKCDYPLERSIYLVNFRDAIGSQQGGIRPALVASNNTYNKFSPTITVIPITSKINKKSPVHVLIDANSLNGLSKDSVIEVEKMRDINKFQLIKKMGTISVEEERKVAEKFTIQFPMLISLLKN